MTPPIPTSPGAEPNAVPNAVPRLSVVIPVHNSSASLGDSVRAVLDAAGADDEIVIADDGSTDDCVAELGPDVLERIIVVRSPVNIGRGPIRNLGAESTTGDVLVFIDSDVAIERTALDRIRSAFTAAPDRVAVIGSYDDRPNDPGRVSQYRNLLHHHTHHTHGSTATHFWTGIGAVRREAFMAVGGLDKARWARDLEDVEFGHRLIDAGHTIEVMPDICGTHYKPYTLGSMIRVDLRERSIPWTHMMITNRFRTDEFVTSPVQVLSALLAAVMLVTLVLLPFRPLMAVAIELVCLLAFIGVNWSLWRRLADRRGPGFALGCIPLHLVHTTVSGLGFVIAIGQRVQHVVLLKRWRNQRRRRAERARGSSD